MCRVKVAVTVLFFKLNLFTSHYIRHRHLPHFNRQQTFSWRNNFGIIMKVLSTKQYYICFFVCKITMGENLLIPTRQSLASNELKKLDFGNVPIDTTADKYLDILNTTEKYITYKASLLYILDSIDNVFKISVPDAVVKPDETIEVKVQFKPNNKNSSYTEHYIIEDTVGNFYRLTVSGSCFGPEVYLSKRKLRFIICKNVTEGRIEFVDIINKSSVDTTYQWLLPIGGQGNFQIPTGNCGLIRAFETITLTVIFTGCALGVYTSELVCLVLNQEPLLLQALATVFVAGNNRIDSLRDHVFENVYKKTSASAHIMENSLNRLTYIPSASVFERYLDFGMGSANDVTRNISQTLCVTNHRENQGFMQWVPDPDNIFLIDPIATLIPPNESKLFTVRFRPKLDNDVYSYLMCGDFQYWIYRGENLSVKKTQHTWYRIPCIGNTWTPCSEWTAEWECPTEVVLPPTVPGRATFRNFMLANRLEIPMYFNFEAPYATNFVMMPMCGIVQGRGWQIISVSLEPKSFGVYCESWVLTINKANKVRINLHGNAEISQVDVMSQGFHPNAHALYEFPPTITGCTNYCTSYLHNLTRMDVHVRVLNYVSWLGADTLGSVVIRPKEIFRYQWWFFPKTPDLVYHTTVTCSCVCLIDGRPVGEPVDLRLYFSGFSENPDLKVLARFNNLKDIVVGESKTISLTLYNYGSCFFTSKLYHLINGMGDDWSDDRVAIEYPVNSLKPSSHCEVKVTVTPGGAGPRQISLKYTVLFRTEFGEIEEIQPIKKKVCKIWYDGIYPTLKVKRTISVKCPIILSDHCVWNITNVDELNKAFMDCRPNKPLPVDLFAPDLCVRPSAVEFVFVLGCVFNVPVTWAFKREKICECPMEEVKIGISTYTMRHTCIHRPLLELEPLSGTTTKTSPSLLHIHFKYNYEKMNKLCFVITMPNQRSIYIYFHIFAHSISKGILVALRRPSKQYKDYLAVMDCGRVPINNLDPVMRITWLYNPTDVFATWRLLRTNTVTDSENAIRCLLYFAEIPPLGKLAIPFAFMPSEMINYETVFKCSFGYETVKILVKGQGGLPNCYEQRLDMPIFTERIYRSAYRENKVYLSKGHFTLPMMPTHSLDRQILGICNDTDHIMRFIWLPEKIPNIVNVVMTPCWGVIHPKKNEWVTMTVYTLQEPATLTLTVTCEILDLTERKRYQQNEALRRFKREKCAQEFIIIEEGYFHQEINDEPPYVEDIEKPQAFHISFTVAVCSKGQRDGYQRLLLRQMWEQTPAYDLLAADWNQDKQRDTRMGNSIPMTDMIRIIDGILWDALHSKMFKNQIKFYSKEEVPVYEDLKSILESRKQTSLSHRVTAGICDAIVNKAVFRVYSLTPKDDISVLEAE